MDYAIIRVGGKQYRVREGETLVVDRVKADEGKTFNPDVLLGDSGVTVTAKVVAHERGPKVRIGKYKRRTGYKRHNGFRAATSRIEISLGGSKKKTATAAPKKAEAPKPAEAPKVEATSALPEGYADLTIVQIKEDAAGWDRPAVEAALEYEQSNAARKGAVAALESALKAKED